MSDMTEFTRTVKLVGIGLAVLCAGYLTGVTFNSQAWFLAVWFGLCTVILSYSFFSFLNEPEVYSYSESRQPSDGPITFYGLGFVLDRYGDDIVRMQPTEMIAAGAFEDVEADGQPLTFNGQQIGTIESLRWEDNGLVAGGSITNDQFAKILKDHR